MVRAAVGSELSAAEQRELEPLARAEDWPGHGPSGAHRVGRFGGIVEQSDLPGRGCGRQQGRQVAPSLAVHRTDGLLDEPRPGTLRQIGGDAIADTIRLTLWATPPSATYWSLRSIARAVDTHHPPFTILERVRTAAASQRDVQAVDRPALCGEDPRHRRALSGITRAGASAVRG